MTIRNLLVGALATAALLPFAAARAQETSIRGFTDVTYHASSDTSAHSSFALGQFALFITSRISDRWSFLGESVFEFDDAASEFGVDVERVIISYRATDHLRLSAGKHHNPLGYWNNAFHHGAVMQPTIDRPRLDAFEDDGGLLPVHAVGVVASGRDIGAAHLGFDVLVGNGIGSTPESDDNRGKAVTVALSSQLTSALQVGVNGYSDRLSAQTPALGQAGVLAQPMRQQIAGGYAAYMGPVLESIAEFQHVANTLPGAKASGNDGYFVYGGVRTGRWVTYGRFERFAVAAGDPYYLMPSQRTGLVGGRWDFSALTTGKLEVRRIHFDGQKDATQLAAQIAVGF